MNKAALFSVCPRSDKGHIGNLAVRRVGLTLEPVRERVDLDLCSLGDTELLHSRQKAADDFGAVFAVRPHRRSAAGGYVFEHRRPRQFRASKHVIESASDIVMDTSAAERLGDPVLDLLPENDRRRGGNPDAKIRFLKDDEATRLDQA
jgi:hypothetical protein